MINDMYWGFTNNETGFPSVGDFGNMQKRKRVSESMNEKHHEIYDPLIYTFGKEVHFSSDINKLTIEILIKQMMAVIHEYYDDYDSRGEQLEITYIVDTPGGSAVSVLKFVDFINISKSKYPNLKFKSVISGLAASAGTIMSCVADSRIMTRYAKAMIHDLAGQKNGTYTQMLAQFEFTKDLNDTLVDIYMKHSHKSKDELSELLKSNKWFNSEQYLEYGFVDSIA